MIWAATLEHNFWSNGKRLRHAEAKCLTEPKMNFITNPDAKNKRRYAYNSYLLKLFLNYTWYSLKFSLYMNVADFSDEFSAILYYCIYHLLVIDLSAPSSVCSSKDSAFNLISMSAL